MDWAEMGEQQQLPITDCHFAADEFQSLSDAVYGGTTANYCFEEEPVFAESLSGHSSDSGNYSPTCSSMPECASNAFDLENAQNWPQNPPNPMAETGLSDHQQHYWDGPNGPELFPTEHFPTNQPTNGLQNYQNDAIFDHTSANFVHTNQQRPLPQKQQYQPIPQQDPGRFAANGSAGNVQRVAAPREMVFLIKQQQPLIVPSPASIKKVLLPASSHQHHAMLINPVKIERIAPPPTPVYQLVPSAAITSKTTVHHQQNGSRKPTEDDDFVKKMEDRKMRNRAAAQMSRQRKKEEGDKMLQELDGANKRCRELETENRHLKTRVQQLEQENKQLLERNNAQQQHQHAPIKRKYDGSRPKAAAAKTAGAGVCMLMLLSWMVLPDFSMDTQRQQQQLLLEAATNGGDNGDQQKIAPFAAIVMAHGRSLQSTNSSAVYGKKAIMPYNNATTVDHLINATMAMACGGLSSRIYNESLNIKLSEDLFTWISRHEKMELVQLRRGKLPPLMGGTSQQQQQIMPLPKLRINSSEFEADGNDDLAKGREKQRKQQRMTRNMAGTRKGSSASKENPTMEDKPPKSLRDLRRVLSLVNKNNNRKNDAGNTAGNVPPAHLDVQQMAKLVKGIKGGGGGGRDNTLYVIPLHDYFLLPPAEKGNGNSTTTKVQLPKLSIILPALSPPLNSSAPFNQLAMIRIECEVIGTNLFYLPEGLVNSLSGVKMPHF